MASTHVRREPAQDTLDALRAEALDAVAPLRRRLAREPPYMPGETMVPTPAG